MHGSAEILDSGGDRHGDGQDVIDEQGARHGQAGLGSEVGIGHLVVAAAARVGVDVLAVGRDDGEHQHDDREGDPGAVLVRRDARDRQDQQDLTGGVRHGGERVGREDGKGDPLGKEGFTEAVAA